MTDLSRRIAALTPEKRALLARQLQKKAEQSATVQTQTIPRYPQADAYPLSFSQEQLWFLDQFEPDSPLYNTPIAVRIEGAIQIDILERSLNEIIRRHNVLRTIYPAIDGKPSQVIMPFLPMPLSTIDLTDQPETERESAALQLMIERSKEPFNLSSDRMIRSLLIHLNEQEHLLLVIVHHIAIDGWSIGILLNEIIALYQDFLAGRPASLPELPIQYTDFAQWQLEHLQGEELQLQLSYWRDILGGDLPVIEMPTDRPRASSYVFRGARYDFKISAALREKLHQVSQQYGVTLFMTLLAGLATLLYRYTGQEDILIGTPIANRTYREQEGLIGFFANSLLLRIGLANDPDVVQLLKRVQEITLGAYAHQDIPLEKIIKEIHSERNLSGTPLLQIMFVLQNSPLNMVEMPGLKLKTQAIDNGTSKFDLTFSLADVNNNLTGSIEYNTELFDASTIVRMVAHFQQLLESLTLYTERTISTLPLLTADERNMMLVQWNDTQASYPQDRCIHQLFEQQVLKNPTHIAAICEEDSLTYEQLNQRANQLAHYLQMLGIGPDCVVGICFERSLQMIIGLVAILKAGGAYVSLDPNYPQERLAFMLEDAHIPVLLTQKKLLLNLPEHQAHVICLDRDWELIQQQPDTNPESEVNPDNLVYMIYTSGSTGRPKGVLLNHRGRVNNFSDFNRRFTIGAQDKLLAISSPSFDMSAYDVFGTLAAGATIVLPEASSERNPVHWAELIKQHHITVWHSVPALLELLVDYLSDKGETEPLSLRLALLGGDWIPVTLPDRLRKFVTHLQFISLGGATEASMDSTIYEVKEVDPEWKSIPYGRPMANQRCYILDTHLQPLPIGIPGELHLAGFGLARGYLNAPEMTNAKFIANPVPEEEGERLYKTGDLARYMPDGNTELLGRMDHQVKIRGVRIELGEIESVLRQHAAVQNVLVVARDDEHGHKRLVAYVVAQPGETIRREDLSNFAKDQLPETMIPSAFVMLDRLPLTPNGKVDRRNLPDPEKTTPSANQGYVAPRTPVEQILAEIWAQALHLEQIGIHDNFFALGGDSILSIQTIARANNRGIRLTPKQLFQHQTIAELAKIAEVTSRMSSEQEVIGGALPLTPMQADLLVHSGHTHQIVQLEIAQPCDSENVRASITELVRLHDALRTSLMKNGEHWQQEYIPLEAKENLFTYQDLSEKSEQDQKAALEAIIHASYNAEFSKDSIFRAIFVDCGSNQPARLFLISHHLIMDTISWKILLEDLNTLYLQQEGARDIQLPARTKPFSRWVHYLAQLATAAEIRQDVAYWNAQLVPHPLIRTKGLQKPEDNEPTWSIITQQFNPTETKMLLQDLSLAYHADTTEILLTALTQALTSQGDIPTVLVQLERDGRQHAPEELDFAHTIGQFTTSYPVLLQAETSSTILDVLQSLKERLRSIPHQGLSYGIHIPDGEVDGASSSIEPFAQAEITFAKHEAVTHLSEQRSKFKLVPEQFYCDHYSAKKSPQALRIEWSIVNEQLQLTWQYNHTHYEHAEIETAMQLYRQGIEALLRAYRTHSKRGLLPSDFPLVSVSQQQLEHLQQVYHPIEDMYPLSPQQRMMLKHSIQKPGSGIYMIHVNYVINIDMDIEALQRAWQTIIQRYPVLRSSFVWEGLEQPVQIVHPDIQMPIEQHDWRQISIDEQRARLDALIQEDRRRGYDLSQAPMMRLFVIRLTDQSYEYIWSNHHILLDGWSRSSIQKEVFTLYSQLCQHQNVQFSYVRPFKDYIEWLQQQNSEQAETFWRQNLQGFKEPTPLIASKGRLTEDSSFGKQKVQLSVALTNELQSFTRQHFLTANTLVQGAWLLLLSRYTKERELLMGVTSSARPVSLAGIETVVGLLSNTIPLRVTITPEASLLSWLQDLQTLQVDLRQYEYHPWQQVQAWSEIPLDRQMFESYLVFENYPWDFQNVTLNVDVSHPLSQKDYTVAQTEFPLRLDAVPAAGLILAMSYYRRYFDDETIASMLQDWQGILEHMIQDPARKLIDFLTEEQ